LFFRLALASGHPNVRLAAMSGRLNAGTLRPAPGWPELHDKYRAVLRKLNPSEM
jgi:hypothetical protein